MNIRRHMLVVLVLLTGFVVAAQAVEFPGRQQEKYKNLRWIDIDQLHKEFVNKTVTLVDVRSKLEYETIHTQDAVHIPVAESGFEDSLKEFVRSNPGKKTAFY